MKKTLKLTLFIVFISLSLLTHFKIFSQRASAANYNPGHIIDDEIFTDKTSMTPGDIQNFLNSKVPVCDTNHQGGDPNYPPPYICLKDYVEGGRSAAQIIWDAAQQYNISPKVLLVTLQKENGLVTDTWPYPWQYRTAMGFGCPDGQPCDAQWYGFTNQVNQGARHFRGFVELNPNWYVPFRPGNNFIAFHPDTNRCGGSNVYIVNNATSALYSYTPYQPNAAALATKYGSGDGCSSYGNRNFFNYFNDWFGSTYSNRCNYDTPGVPSTNQLFHKYNRGIDSADFIIYTGSSTNCIESHIWNNGMQSWQTHIASNQPKVSYPSTQVLFGDLDGSGYDYPLLFGVQGTSTGKVESHVWNRDMRSWLAHTASNQAVIDPADCKIVIADLDGNQKEDPTLICLRNTSTGKIELHTWNPGMQTWRNHIVTNMPAVDPSVMTVVSGDVDGNGADELILVAYGGTTTGKVEFHVWNSGQQTWWLHYATNLATINSSQAKIEFADIDGNKVDEAVLVKFTNTGSGKIEFHIWNPGYYSWRSHIASNQNTL